MTLPKDVADAMASLECEIADPMDCTAWRAVRAHLLSQDATNQRLREVGRKAVLANADLRQQTYALESRLAAADALITEWRGLVLGHNAECKIACDPDRCKYRPYLEANGRRCPECPVNDMIEIPAHLQGYGDEANRRTTGECQ